MAEENVVQIAPTPQVKRQPWCVDTGLKVADSVVFVCSGEPSNAATLAPQGSKTVWCVACRERHRVCNLVEGLERNRIDTVDGAVLIDMGDFLAAILRQKGAAAQA